MLGMEAAIISAEVMAHYARLQRQQETRALAFFGYNFTPGTHLAWKKCKYCGRDRQSHAHKTCDGCGAPRETVRLDPPTIHVW